MVCVLQRPCRAVLLCMQSFMQFVEQIRINADFCDVPRKRPAEDCVGVARILRNVRGGGDDFRHNETPLFSFILRIHLFHQFPELLTVCDGCVVFQLVEFFHLFGEALAELYHGVAIPFVLAYADAALIPASAAVLNPASAAVLNPSFIINLMRNGRKNNRKIRAFHGNWRVQRS